MITIDLCVGFFVWLVGLCVGSFLNVVVYRLPRDLPVYQPARSFCPQCGQGIAWYDNIPLLSWLLLRARCRRCGAAISVQYPLVEAVTGLTFVLVYYLLFVIDARVGAAQLGHPHDWPLLLAWLVLVGALIACAAMDLVSYMVDVRITYAAMILGLVGYAIWPRETLCGPLTSTPAAAAAVTMFITSIILLWLTVWREPEMEAPEAETEEEPKTSEASARMLGGNLAILLFVGLTFWLFAETAMQGHDARDVYQLSLPENIERYDVTMRPPGGGIAPHWVVPAALLAVFATTVLVGAQPRAADAEVKAAINEEQPQARKVVLWELAWLAGPLVVGALTYVLVAYVPAFKSAWESAVQWSPGAGLCPAGGAVYAIFGAMAGAAAGWVLRIVFTLIFGREALGVGDIYILAAAGAAGGWDIALLGLLLAIGVAIVGYTLSLLLKCTAIIPFGPWLAIGFITALWLNRRALTVAEHYYQDITAAWTQRPDLCRIASGLMLVGSILAIVLARLARRLIERTEE